jgi:hypothetical protein
VLHVLLAHSAFAEDFTGPVASVLDRDTIEVLHSGNANRIRDSDDEIEYLASPRPRDMRDVCHGLTDEMLAKLRSTVERARKQLLALEDENVRCRIVYLSIRIGSLNATHKTRDEIIQFCEETMDDQIEIVHLIENEFLL